MKLDGEQVFCHGTGDNKSNSKPFGCNKTALDSIGLKSRNIIVNEDQNGVFYDLKARVGNADQLQYPLNDEDDWKASKVDSCMSVDVSLHDDEKAVRDFAAPIPLTHSSPKVESFDKDSVFYIDKNVMEPELPELVVCYKENTYHVVKDICVDEGVPSQDKFFFDTGDDEKKLCKFLIPEDIENEKAKERVDLDTSTPYLSKNGFSLKCDSKESMPIEDDAIEENANDTSKETFSLGELLSMPELGAELSQSKSLLNTTDEAEQVLIQRPSESTVIAISSACKESENGREHSLLATPTVDPVAEEAGHEEAMLGTLNSDSAAKVSDHGHDESILAHPAPHSATEEPENGAKEEILPSQTSTIGDELSCNSKMENKSATSDFNSSAPTATGGEEACQNGGSDHLENRNSCRHEDTSTEPFSSQLQYSHGESSFSAAGPISGLISYSGPIAYSGSLSLRSDSSTTSTRSFAFPILQSEWNSSPVRMAKADRRHSRKHNWRQGLLCCRF